MSDLPAISFRNARVLRPEGFSDHPIGISAGLISDADEGREVDLSGYMLLPGIIDLHGDGFERHLAPRRGAVRDPAEGLRALEGELASNGITTSFLAQFFSWEGGMRGPGFAEKLAHALPEFDTLLDLRLQLRLEINLLSEYPRALQLIREAAIGYVVFNDHLPHKALSAGRKPPRLTGQALKSGRSPEAHLKLLQELHAQSSQVPEHLADLARTLLAEGVRIGSHDDPDAATRERMRAMGADISEFPLALEAAAEARAGGDGVIMGAPNVVRGGSHDGRISARQVIEQGNCDLLVSDYHYPALRQAAFVLSDSGVLSLSEAWALISSRPAALLGWQDRGELVAGKRADLVILDAETRRVAACFAGGQIAYLSGAVAARFLG